MCSYVVICCYPQKKSENVNPIYEMGNKNAWNPHPVFVVVILVGGWPTPLKNHGVHSYEMENKSHVWNPHPVFVVVIPQSKIRKSVNPYWNSDLFHCSFFGGMTCRNQSANLQISAEVKQNPRQAEIWLNLPRYIGSIFAWNIQSYPLVN